MSRRSANTRPEAWLLHAPQQSARVRLFCVPHAGGGAASYRSWIQRLAPDIHAVPVQLPGRETRFSEPPIDRMEPLIAALAPALALHTAQPFALFGHSMGALVAFEVAHALVAQGIFPVHLFVSGSPAPELAYRDGHVHTLPDDQLILRLRFLAGTPLPVLQSPMLLELLLPVLRADYAVCETYRCQPRPPLPVPITCMGGMQDPVVAQEHLSLWQAHTASQFFVHRFPGGHFYLQDAQDDILGIIMRRLADVGA